MARSLVSVALEALIVLEMPPYCAKDGCDDNMDDKYTGVRAGP